MQGKSKKRVLVQSGSKIVVLANVPETTFRQVSHADRGDDGMGMGKGSFNEELKGVFGCIV